ncbi:T-cell surface glycoprotein CD8 alpha chain [Brachionichthys hirsutus]|uniref:T-cell surface glycoprotein CD8 alpha chain n=1 Tax=Brachionichthys hirsutus TaxID=412623 RepID=UPI003604B8C7
MDQSWILILLILVFYQKVASGDDVIVEDGRPVVIRCQPEMGSMVLWFRVLDHRGMEFIGSFTNTGLQKSTFAPSSPFSFAKMRQHDLVLPAFDRVRDSGAYSCASLHKGTELKFGGVTRLVGDSIDFLSSVERKREREVPVTAGTAAAAEGTRRTACACGAEEASPSALCAPSILGPLAGGCGLLLLLLLIVITHCNRLRTRRCPHHYKRKPRVMAGGKQ